MSALIADGELQYHGDELVEVLVEFVDGRPVLAYRNDDRSPYEPLSAAWENLKGTEVADELCAAVTVLLGHPDGLVRSTAINFFATAHTADGDEALLHLLEGESPLYTGVLDPDPHAEGGYELRDILARTVSQRRRRLGTLGRDLLRREALTPGRARLVMAGLWKHDRQWLEEHAVEVVSGTPAALKTYLRSRLWSDDLDPRPLLLSLRGKLPSATVHAAIRAVYPEGVERLMYLFESAPATLEERDGQPPAPQTSSGAPLWAANDSGNPDLIRTHIALARQLPTQDEQAARLYFLGNALAELSGGHVEEGLTVLREAAQLGSHHAAYDAALILFHGEDVEKDLVAARVLLEQAADLERRNSRIQMMLYRNYAGLGRSRNAAQSLERYLELRPNDPNADEYRETIESLRN